MLLPVGIYRPRTDPEGKREREERRGKVAADIRAEVGVEIEKERFARIRHFFRVMHLRGISGF